MDVLLSDLASVSIITALWFSQNGEVEIQEKLEVLVGLVGIYLVGLCRNDVVVNSRRNISSDSHFFGKLVPKGSTLFFVILFRGLVDYIMKPDCQVNNFEFL
eukprot:TRINITY_DN2538_c0_g1_i10.p1 TRINITY_DN2538_c0_g1~~TRINITY_DN2538_c0_g1_i10.p1  ORF type:complete len:102 (-),score=12.27 TRINITY_DN2538_c0_g1_i10:277-582(-)